LKTPCYNVSGATTAVFCKDHKDDDMIDVKHDRCSYNGCETSPSYNVEGGKPLFCVDHKSPEMIDVINDKCECDGCPTIAGFGPIFKAKRHCVAHKLNNEYANNNPKCEYLLCRSLPFYTDIGNFPKRCEEHKLANDSNIIEIPCISCNLPDMINETTKLCNSCVGYSVLRKAKETYVLS
jgi:hypothetical protein